MNLNFLFYAVLANFEVLAFHKVPTKYSTCCPRGPSESELVSTKEFDIVSNSGLNLRDIFKII